MYNLFQLKAYILLELGNLYCVSTSVGRMQNQNNSETCSGSDFRIDISFKTINQSSVKKSNFFNGNLKL